MQPTKSLLLTVMFLLTAFAGCSGDDETLAATFVATPIDADKSRFKFDASSSTGKDLKFSWDFGDRSEPVTGETVDHTYEYPNGDYDVTLTVTDATGASKTVTQSVVTGNGQNQAPRLYLTVDKRRVMAEESILFDGSMSIDPDNDPLFFEWDFNSQLDDQSLNDLENLGNQQYGRYPEGKEPPAGSSSGNGGNGTGGETGMTPSGHDWQAEVQKARQRLLERIGAGGFHGGAEGSAEPRNAEFDGRVTDTSPVQFFLYPSPAVYYVHVRVEDIKGDGEEGFIKISVDTTIPPATNTSTLTGTLVPGALEPLGPTTGQNDLRSWREHAIRYEYPGTTTVTLTFTSQPEGGLVGVYVCGTGGLAECKQGARKLEAGASGRTFAFDISPGESLPSNWKAFVENAASSNARIEYSVKVDTVFDLNPWAKEEAGFGGAHH